MQALLLRNQVCPSRLGWLEQQEDMMPGPRYLMQTSLLIMSRKCLLVVAYVHATLNTCAPHIGLVGSRAAGLSDCWLITLCAIPSYNPWRPDTKSNRLGSSPNHLSEAV